MTTGMRALMMTVAAGVAGTASANIIQNELGPADQYAVLGLTGSADHMSSGPLVVTGNVGVDAGAQFTIDGGGKINGTVYSDPTATVTASGYSMTMQSMATVQTDAINAANYFAALTPTNTTYSSITSATTIAGNGGLNVISLPGGFNLSNGNLTLSGGANDVFIIQVGASSSLQGGSQIALNGVKPDQVLFDFTGTGGFQQSSNGAIATGYFLAPKAGIQINGSNTTSDTAEFISGGTMSFQSNPVVNAIPVPLPAAAWLLLSGLGGLGLLGKRREQQLPV